jgi:hypothetical protein
MRLKLIWLVLCSVAIAVVALYRAESVLATSTQGGYKATTIASGTFEEFQVFNHLSKDKLPDGFDGDVWLSLQKTKGRSDLYVQSNVWPAVNPTTGAVASTGWHTHPGHSLIIVTAGTLTEYDDTCTALVHNKGDTFVDPGDGHVHIIRNESPTAPASTLAVQLVPYDPQRLNRRIDAPAPESCQSIF